MKKMDNHNNMDWSLQRARIPKGAKNIRKTQWPFASCVPLGWCNPWSLTRAHQIKSSYTSRRKTKISKAMHDCRFWCPKVDSRLSPNYLAVNESIQPRSDPVAYGCLRNLSDRGGVKTCWHRPPQRLDHLAASGYECQGVGINPLPLDDRHCSWSALKFMLSFVLFFGIFTDIFITKLVGKTHSLRLMLHWAAIHDSMLEIVLDCAVNSVTLFR